jgi:DNA-3-methyladenine glycosylase
MVCLGEEGSASAVLLRAGAIIAGEDLARARRTRGATRIAPRDLARGPARLCQALGIDRSLDGADVCVAGSPLRVCAGAGNPVRSAVLAGGDETLIPPGTPRRIVTGPRVGVSSAAEIPWRYWYDGDPTVSAYRAHVPRQRKLVTP